MKARMLFVLFLMLINFISCNNLSKTRIYGVIYRSDTGERISGAMIRLGDAKKRTSWQPGQSAIIAQTVTGFDGKYEFGSLRQGQYYLVVIIPKSLQSCDYFGSDFMTADGWTDAGGLSFDMVGIASPHDSPKNVRFNESIKWDVDISCVASNSDALHNTDKQLAQQANQKVVTLQCLKDQTASACFSGLQYNIRISFVHEPKDPDKTFLLLHAHVENAGKTAGDIYNKFQIRDGNARVLKMLSEDQVQGYQEIKGVFNKLIRLENQSAIINPGETKVMLLAFSPPGKIGPFTIEPISGFICNDKNNFNDGAATKDKPCVTVSIDSINEYLDSILEIRPDNWLVGEEVIKILNYGQYIKTIEDLECLSRDDKDKIYKINTKLGILARKIVPQSELDK